VMHPGHLPSPPDAATWIRWWTFDPLVIAGLATASIVYAVGVRRLYRVAGAGRRALMYRTLAYDAGILVCALALLSPLDHASDVLFSAHMAQHELLMVVAAPLLVLGKPVIPMIWALPQSWRTPVASAVQDGAIGRAWSHLTGPLTATTLHAIALWIWHIPFLYEATLRNDYIHGFEHFCFFITAALFWWALIHGRYGRIGYGVAVFYVFLTSMHSGALAALMTFSSRVWYPYYQRAGLQWGIDPVQDQQLAGLIMWVPAGLVLVVLGLALFAMWLGEAEKRVAINER
jgi:putative membrane protein